MADFVCSVFWHQHTRQKLNGPATFITNGILRFKSGTLITRYVNLILTFMISGLMHWMVDVSGGLSWRRSGAFRFFYTQALGIMLEDALQAIYRHSRGTQRDPGPPQRWIRMLGYLWVLIFFAWSSPAWFYPILRPITRDPKYEPLPFSLTVLLKKLVSLWTHR